MKKTKRTVIILYAISVVVFLAYWGLYWLSRRLETFDGFYTNYPTPIGVGAGIYPFHRCTALFTVDACLWQKRK